MLDTLPELGFAQWRALPLADCVLLTVNARLGRALLRDWLGQEQATPAPRLYGLQQWLDTAIAPLLAGGLTPPGRRLQAFEETWLWQAAIAAQEGADSLLDPHDAARLARDAHAIECEWPLRIPAAEQTPEYARYRLWQAAFIDECRQRGLMDDARWQAWQRQQILAHPQCWPRYLILAGFDELSPAWSDFFTTLASRGVQLMRLQRRPASPERLHYTCTDAESELRTAVQWAAQQINAGLRVALVLPDLAQRRAHVSRVLDEVLHPECADPAHWESSRRYNISLGEPLAGQAPVRSALACLRLLLQAEGWHLPDAAPWLLSPWLHSLTGQLQQAVREAQWRRGTRARLSWNQLAQQEWASAWCEARAGLLVTRRAPPSTWVARFASALNTLGWPGARQPSSHEYQMLEAWQAALHDFCLLDEGCGPLDASTALMLLQRFMRERIFQVQSSADAPLQVLGLLETAGGEFDAMWLLGLTDECLPARPRPNALLPARWQRRHQTPHSSSQREAAFARRLLQDVETCAPRVIASHARFEGETELRPSPLLADWPAAEAPLLVRPPLQPAAMERLQDEQGLPLQPGQRVRGGVRVLELQAIQPLWAYAECRLGAAPLQPWRLYPDARLRGTLAHAVMEQCWDVLQDQQRLLQLDEAGQHQHVQHSVEQAMRANDDLLRDCGRRWLQLEQRRLYRLLQRWLELERQRPCAFRVCAQEQERVWQHGPLQLTLRLDRMDRLDSGLLLIDYKTGKASPAGWGEPDDAARPLRQVQLPLYALALAGEAPVIGTAFACLAPRPADFGFRARLQQPDLLRPLTTAPDEATLEQARERWQQTLEFWKDSLHQLAEDFASGLARNTPCPPALLRWCSILPFLRLPTASDSDTDSDEDTHAPSPF